MCVNYCFIETLKWSKPLVSGSAPLPRIGHSACIIGHCIYIYGGYNQHPNDCIEDLHKLDLNTMKWSVVKTEVCYKHVLLCTPFIIYYLL